MRNLELDSRASRITLARPRRAGVLLVGALTVLGIATGCSRDSEAAPGGPAPSAAPQPAGPNHVVGKNYVIDMALDGECKAQAECTLKIRLTATGAFHINKDYPYKFKAEAAGVTFLGTDAGGPNVFSKAAKDFVQDEETKGTMTVKFKPSKSGPLTLGGTYKMSVCSKDQCQLETQDLKGVFAVK